MNCDQYPYGSNSCVKQKYMNEIISICSSGSSTEQIPKPNYCKPNGNNTFGRFITTLSSKLLLILMISFFL